MIGRLRRSHAVAVSLLLAGWVTPRAAHAQTLDVERFKPAVTHDGFVMMKGAGVRDPEDRWEVGLFANYGRNQLVIVNNGNVTGHFVSGRLGADLLGSVTVAGPFAIGLDLPVFLAQTGDACTLVRRARRSAYRPQAAASWTTASSIGLGLAVEVRAPTHVGDFSGGARNVVVWPKLLLDHRFANGIRFGVNGGVSIREKTQFVNVQAGTEVTYGGALGYRIGGLAGKVELGGEVDGAVGFAAQQKEELPLEGLLYVKIDPTDEWEISAGPGFGLIGGYGVPIARGFAGIRYTPTSHDRDHDGVPDDRDQCPDVPEDRDGDHDTDGCPEADPDDDHDGVPNSEDDCPKEKETINGFQDEDGCPDTGDRRVIYEDGQVKVLDTVRFESGSAKLKPESYSLLNQVALTIRANPEIRHVRIEGHTDETGTHELNMQLSRERAQAVRTYLINRRIEGSRLSAEGYGPDRPLVHGTDEKARAKNRRVDFIVEK